MNKIVRVLINSGIFFCILFADRFSKLYALYHCQERCYINPYLSFDLALNRGISWGFFHSYNPTVFLGVSILIALITVMVALYGFYCLYIGRPMIGNTLVVAGSLGNLIDRYYYQGVIDFIEVSYKSYTWPVFNIADICIVVGVFLVVMEYYKS